MLLVSIVSKEADGGMDTGVASAEVDSDVAMRCERWMAAF